jgi:hypothetical protein
MVHDMATQEAHQPEIDFRRGNPVLAPRGWTLRIAGGFGPDRSQTGILVHAGGWLELDFDLPLPTAQLKLVLLHRVEQKPLEGYGAFSIFLDNQPVQRGDAASMREIEETFDLGAVPAGPHTLRIVLSHKAIGELGVRRLRLEVE